MAIALAFHLDLSHADIGSALLVLAAATFPVLGLGIFTSVLPLLSPEKGEQMTVAVQGVLLLVSGVYYPISVLPAVFRSDGRRVAADLHAHRDPRRRCSTTPGAGALLGTILLLLAMGAVLIPCGILVFARAERRAKRLGLLKRNGVEVRRIEGSAGPVALTNILTGAYICPCERRGQSRRTAGDAGQASPHPA